MSLSRTRTLSEASSKQGLTCLDKNAEKDGSFARQNAIEKRESELSVANEFQHLVLVTSKIRQFSMLEKSCRPGILLLQLKNDSTLESILQIVEEELDGKKVNSVAFIAHGQPGKMSICYDKFLSIKPSQGDELEIKMFFKELVDLFVDKSNSDAALDFLSCPLIQGADGSHVIQNLQEYIKVPVRATKDALGEETFDRNGNGLHYIGDIYFKAELLRGWSGSGAQSISQFEKIRTVGKGAYGTAVLYRKKDDDSLVILKEINIHDLTANERQMAKNEVKVLSMLSHPNIISYYDSFEEDGTLLIEMEYADGGTLAQYLAKQEKELDEKEILSLFQQMLAAIKYCHDHNILHRDMKTANIFLTKEGKVKLGDFGIAKIMSTRQDANTVLGTPYYISPEMCEGKPYNEKSDIWALGCILYEMANLQKTFEGTNLPALVNKIMKGTFAPIKDIYSVGFRVLVRDMLQKDPRMRPSAEELLFYRLHDLMSKYERTSEKEDDLGPIGTGSRRSLLYYYDLTTMTLHQVQDLPPKIQLTEVAVGLGHISAVSLERGIFTWGDNTFGQLGHGDVKRKNVPYEVVALRGKSVMRTGCGDNFTAFLSDNGLILTCGQGDFGCLGHGNLSSTSKPKLIDDLLTRDVESLSCGAQHVAITTTEGLAFTWGCGADGRLGTGSDDNCCVPTEVIFTERVFVRDVRCGYDCTAFILDTGTVYACGRNDNNKLGLNPRLGFLSQFKITRSNKSPVDFQKTPSLIKDLCKYQMADVAFGQSHSAFLSETGHVFTLGNNADGQLGNGSTKQRDTFSTARCTEDMQTMLIACGSSFSLSGTKDNRMCFWGTRPSRRKRFHSTDSISPTQSLNNTTLLRRSRKGSARSEESEEKVLTIDDDSQGFKSDNECRVSSAKRPSSLTKIQRESMRSPLERGGSAGSPYDDTMETENDFITTERRRYLQGVATKRDCQQGSVGTLKMGDREKAQAIIVPEEILHFEAYSEANGFVLEREYPVMLQDIKCMRDHVLIQLETTAPPPPKRKRRLTRKESDHQTNRKTLDDSSSSIASHGQDEHTSSETSEMDSYGEVPTWIKDELKSGIPLKESMDASSDTNSSDDESKGRTNKQRQNEASKSSKGSPRMRSRSGSQLSRRLSNQSLMRDPSFNYVQRMSRTNLRHNTSQVNNDVPKTETRIVDGVAITTATTTFRSGSQSSLQDEQRKKSVTANLAEAAHQVDHDVHGMDRISETGESIALLSTGDSKSSSGVESSEVSSKQKGSPSTGDSGVEFTPIEHFHGTSVERSTSKHLSEQTPLPSSRSPLPARSSQLRNSKEGHKKSPGRASNDKITTVRPRAIGRGRNVKAKGTFPDRSILRDEESSKLCQELEKMRNIHQEQEKVMHKVRQDAFESEQRLRNEIDQLKKERTKREKELEMFHKEQLQQAESRSASQQRDSEEKEKVLKEEILGLRRELNHQNSKLQENYDILVSLQEQLLRMQQDQMRQQSLQSLPSDKLQQRLECLDLQQQQKQQRLQHGERGSSPCPSRSTPSTETEDLMSDKNKRVRSSVCEIM